MSAVVDASVLVALTTDSGPESVWAENLVTQGNLAAPDLALAEATNILRRLELAGEIERSQAAAAARDVLQIDITLVPFAPFAGRIWELRHNLTSYDAWYVAAAEALDLPLATLDRRLSTASGPRCPFLLPPPS